MHRPRPNITAKKWKRQLEKIIGKTVDNSQCWKKKRGAAVKLMFGSACCRPPPHPPTTNGAKAIAGIAIGIGTEMQSLTNATIWKA